MIVEIEMKVGWTLVVETVEEEWRDGGRERGSTGQQTWRESGGHGVGGSGGVAGEDGCGGGVVQRLSDIVFRI